MSPPRRIRTATTTIATRPAATALATRGGRPKRARSSAGSDGPYSGRTTLSGRADIRGNLADVLHGEHRTVVDGRLGLEGVHRLRQRVEHRTGIARRVGHQARQPLLAEAPAHAGRVGDAVAVEEQRVAGDEAH